MKPWRAAVALGALLAAAGTAHTLVNLRRLLVPPSPAPPCDERVAVLLPARDEAPRIAAAVSGVRAQRGVPSLRAVVLDDGSTDGTGDLARTRSRHLYNYILESSLHAVCIDLSHNGLFYLYLSIIA